jgi:hypothetical protein
MGPNDFDPRKINSAWTFGPIMWNKGPSMDWSWPPLTDEHAEALAKALNALADELET